ncbi:hypothetical protein Vi05172_g6547 [Venturia inaequalis]|nr:hypothetical protein Vi05172_g6547 [Venturia inaequalis]
MRNFESGSGSENGMQKGGMVAKKSDEAFMTIIKQ